jgi:hypothetical protein
MSSDLQNPSREASVFNLAYTRPAYPLFINFFSVGPLLFNLLRAFTRVCQNLLGKSYVLPTSKKLCKVKKEFISNSLA